MKSEYLKVTQTKSKAGRLRSHQATLSGLGIRRIHQSVTVRNTPEVRGMITKISYMLKVEEL